MFLQAVWGQVSSIINQLTGWYCIVYYCRTHHSSALKASDPWRVPVCVTVMDIVITTPPPLSVYLSFCSVACCTSTSSKLPLCHRYEVWLRWRDNDCRNTWIYCLCVYRLWTNVNVWSYKRRRESCCTSALFLKLLKCIF